MWSWRCPMDGRGWCPKTMEFKPFNPSTTRPRPFLTILCPKLINCPGNIYGRMQYYHYCCCIASYALITCSEIRQIVVTWKELILLWKTHIWPWKLCTQRFIIMSFWLCVKRRSRTSSVINFCTITTCLGVPVVERSCILFYFQEITKRQLKFNIYSHRNISTH